MKITTTTARGVSMAIATFLASGVALAAAEDGHAAAAPANPLSFQVVPFVSTLIVFGIVFWILSSKVWPKISGALQAREDKIRSEIEDAERARRQANAALQQYEKALAEARAEAAKIIDQTKIEQQKLAAQLRAKTEADLNALRDSAMRDMEAAKRSAITEIYSQMAATATTIASKILEREINSSDQQRLVEETLGGLEAVRAN